MQISSFVSSHKCPELVKRFSDNVPRTVDEMLKRVDDYLRNATLTGTTVVDKSTYPLAFRTPERNISYVPPQRPNQEVRRPIAVLTLDSLSSTLQEILAIEHQLRLPQPASLFSFKAAVEVGFGICRNRPLAGRIKTAQKFAEEKHRYLCMRTVRYDWSAKENHQALTERQSARKTGATYQRLIDGAFQSQIGINLEAYVDDMVIKSKSEREMLTDIAEIFDNLRRINMKLNPKKCSFRVEEGKFLGYMVTSEGRLAALNRFLSRGGRRSPLPFRRILKDFTGKQHDTDGQTLHDAERNYAPLEKMALALRHASRRLMSYFEAHPITVITDQPIKQILSKADTSAMVPRQTQYTFEHQKDCKEEWVLYTDGASSAKGFGAGLVLISPTKTEYTYALRINFESTNNQAEYEALLAGLRISKKMGVQSLSVNVDSKMVASEINGNYEACKENMF
ncbi:reverse transcriptase domain-containing protein [Tanacetum coccineum]